MKDLFANYSKEVRPVIDKEQPIPVNFDMVFSQLVELVCIPAHAFPGEVYLWWANAASLSEFLLFILDPVATFSLSRVFERSIIYFGLSLNPKTANGH